MEPGSKSRLSWPPSHMDTPPPQVLGSQTCRLFLSLSRERTLAEPPAPHPPLSWDPDTPQEEEDTYFFQQIGHLVRPDGAKLCLKGLRHGGVRTHSGKERVHSAVSNRWDGEAQRAQPEWLLVCIINKY